MPMVSRKDTNKTFEVSVGEILYDSLLDHGELLPHGCLSGSCGACRVEILEGKENLQAAGVIEKDTIQSLQKEFGEEFCRDKEIRLSCRAKVIGNVSFRPIK